MWESPDAFWQDFPTQLVGIRACYGFPQMRHFHQDGHFMGRFTHRFRSRPNFLIERLRQQHRICASNELRYFECGKISCRFASGPAHPAIVRTSYNEAGFYRKRPYERKLNETTRKSASSITQKPACERQQCQCFQRGRDFGKGQVVIGLKQKIWRRGWDSYLGIVLKKRKLWIL